MIAIIIPIESECSSFFNKRLALVSPILAGEPFNKKSPKSRNRSTKKSLKIKCKNKKKFLGGGKRKKQLGQRATLMTKLLSYSMLIKSSKKRAKSRILQLNDRTNIPYMDMSKYGIFRLHLQFLRTKKPPENRWRQS